MSDITPSSPRSPRFLQSLICFGAIVVTIAGGLFGLGISLHTLMFVCLLWAGINAFSLGYSYLAIRDLMTGSLSRAMPAIYIFILIGMVIASFMHSGTIATLMYYGLSWLSPSLFLAIGMLLCAIMSVATGTSWGTMAVLMPLSIPLVFGMAGEVPDLERERYIGAAIGAVFSGAVFGDHCSPFSDTLL